LRFFSRVTVLDTAANIAKKPFGKKCRHQFLRGEIKVQESYRNQSKSLSPENRSSNWVVLLARLLFSFADAFFPLTSSWIVP